MQYRELGRTGLKVSEIGFGAEWMEKKSPEEVRAVVARCEEAGINILDCWMAGPEVRSNLGAALADTRDKWIIQGHIGSTWQNGQYTRTRDMDQVRPAFEDLLARLGTDHVELGMIHYVDDVDEYESIMAGPFIAYVRELRDAGTIGHIGLSTHSPEVARCAALSGEIEVIMFSVNPAFDLLPATTSLDEAFTFNYADELGGMDPARAELYALCEREGVGLTVMKGYAGGRLFSAEASPFGVALTPVQCIHYALTRPAVASIMAGFDTPSHIDDAVAYETAGDAARDYASVLATAPKHAYFGQCTYCGHCAPCTAGIDIATVNKFYDLATIQDEVPASLRAHYDALDATAADCTACAACEPRCPFGVPIAERMTQAAALFAN
ncbi:MULTISPECIES: aldo/keto reductase [Gordonibacter]|uniref:Aldo/keto reductase n=1 Tax=Gordonibacter faecis TaxID=3047475 RepID=A0ABT7DNF9_9ACTN|nr:MULTISPECIES: aldo/keto reductase [unclassified Gordonibacter]MDJ1651068.1 aldo/keto reductase [Gordonibacter sp. KGMB12511]HIW75372.1 aldo/keto reductase [Candidatus Gordonibacter avicola]